MSGAVRVGVLGLGKIAQLHHLPNLSADRRFEIVALCDLSRDLGDGLRRRFGNDSTLVTDAPAELFDADLDAVVISNRDHYPLLVMSLERGLPTLVEKPACWTAEELDTVVDHPHASRVVVGYMKRYDPAVEILRDLLEDGPEPPFWVRVHNFAGGRHKAGRDGVLRDPSARSHAADERAAIRERVADSLGGTEAHLDVHDLLLELAVHDINVAHHLLGDLKVSHASARRTPAGWLVTIEASAAATSVVMEFAPLLDSHEEWDEELMFYGIDRRYELQFPSPFRAEQRTRLRLRRCREEHVGDEEIVIGPVSAFVAELDALHAVVDGGQARTTLAEARRDHAFVRDALRCLEVS